LILLLFSAFIILITSCQPKYKRCNCRSKNEELKAYSEILNEIVEHRSYNFYLGEDEARIFNEYVKHPTDTIRIHNKVIHLQNEIFNDTSRFCTIYLDTVANRRFNLWSWFLENDTSSFAIRLKSVIHEISNNTQTVLDSVRSIQTKFNPKDFTLCTSNMKFKSDFNTSAHQCSIGVLRLSKISFNAEKNKGLLYYEFADRYGDLLLIEKMNSRWDIKNAIRIWQF
jgi:hypothetical protein